MERRGTLPLRPTTARLLLDPSLEHDESVDASPAGSSPPRRWNDLAVLDPGWAFEIAKQRGRVQPWTTLAELSWWRRPSPVAHEALQRLWRLSAAVGLAAFRLAKEAGDPDPDQLGAAGFLHGLGLWLAASVDSQWLPAWFDQPDLDSRRDFEIQELGVEVDELAVSVAERLGCDPIIRDAIWLHADLGAGLNNVAHCPDRLPLLQRAYALADQTPWGSRPMGLGESRGADSRLKSLIAEVQARTGLDFVESDAGPREEALTRSNARLRLQVADLGQVVTARNGLLDALGRSSPSDTLDQWAEETEATFRGEPGVTRTSVQWDDDLPPPEHSTPPDQFPAVVQSLGLPGYPRATLVLWAETERPLFMADQELMRKAWNSWAALVGSHNQLQVRARHLLKAYRHQVESEQIRLRNAKLEALAEFAAGAGHELNNPLAVIVGRAQLLLVHEKDPKIAKSLRAILTQAQRAHRILRDLMYVARPPEPRPRFCRPDEILRASIRDAKSDSDERDIRLSATGLEHDAKVWADPDGLRHLADTLLRNALEASPKGGVIRFTSEGDGKNLRWTIQDFGRGITAAEGPHLFDPFYCGRQAGRGLGMGLPRAARFVAAGGGEIRWLSNPGQGTSFQVRLPLEEGPRPPILDSNGHGDHAV